MCHTLAETVLQAPEVPLQLPEFESSRILHVRLCLTDYSQLVSQAEAADVTVSELVRQRLFEQSDVTHSNATENSLVIQRQLEIQGSRKPSDTVEGARSMRVTFRLTPSELDSLMKEASDNKKTVSEYTRDKVTNTGNPPSATPNSSPVRRLDGEHWVKVKVNGRMEWLLGRWVKIEANGRREWFLEA